MLPGLVGGRPILRRALTPTPRPGWAGADATLAQTRCCFWAAGSLWSPFCVLASVARPAARGCGRCGARPPPRLSPPRSVAWLPRFARRGRASLLAPRFRARPLVRRCAAPRALAGPAVLRPCRRCAAGFRWAPLLRLRRGSGASRVPRGGRAAARWRGSGPGGSPPGPRRLRRLFRPRGGRAVFCCARLSPLAALLGCCVLRC